MRKNLQDIQALVRFIAARFAQDRCTQTAASLTFTTLLSLVPLITVTLTMFSAFPVFEDFSVQIKTYLLIRDANHIRASELLHLFVLESGTLLAEQSDDPLQQWFFASAGQLEKSTDLSLQELIARTSDTLLIENH